MVHYRTPKVYTKVIGGKTYTVVKDTPNIAGHFWVTASCEGKVYITDVVSGYDSAESSYRNMIKFIESFI